MPIFILFFFIQLFGIPLLVLGIVLEISKHSGDASRFRPLYLTLIIAGISLLFLLPTKIFSFFYFNFLIGVVGVLLVVYFFVKVHGRHMQTNLKLYTIILVLTVAGVLAAIFINLLPEPEAKYNYDDAKRLAHALRMHQVAVSPVFNGADLCITGDTVVGKSNYLALPPPVFNPHSKIFFYLLSQPGVFHVIKPRGDILQNSDVNENTLSPVHFKNKMFYVSMGWGEITQMDMSGQLSKTTVQTGSLTHGGYLFYKNKVITSDNDGVYIISLFNGDILWTRKIDSYKETVNLTLNANLLIFNTVKSINHINTSHTEERCFALNLDNMDLAWQHQPVYQRPGGGDFPKSAGYWVGEQLLAVPAGTGYDILSPQTGRVLHRFKFGQPRIQHLTANRLYSINDSTHTLTAWNLANETRQWQSPADAIVLVHQNDMVTQHNNMLRVVDLATGREKTRFVLKQPLPSALAVKNNILHIGNTLYR